MEELAVLDSPTLVWEMGFNGSARVGWLAVCELLTDPFDGKSEFGGLMLSFRGAEIWIFFGLMLFNQIFFGLMLFNQIVDGVTNDSA